MLAKNVSDHAENSPSRSREEPVSSLRCFNSIGSGPISTDFQSLRHNCLHEHIAGPDACCTHGSLPPSGDEERHLFGVSYRNNAHN